MPKSITIRDISDDVRDELAARAALTGRSLQEYLHAQLSQLAEKPDPDVVVARIRQRKRETRTKLSSAEILRYRDVDRR